MLVCVTIVYSLCDEICTSTLGLSQNHVKQLRVTMRRGYLLCVKRGLNRILQNLSSSSSSPDLPGLYPSQRRLVRLASSVYASEKESKEDDES